MMTAIMNHDKRFRYTHLCFMLFTLLIFSCKEKIDVSLNENTEKIVIEAEVSDELGGVNYVNISKTTSFYDSIYSIPVKADYIIISDNIGNVDSIEGNVSGKNKMISTVGVVGRKYYLKVLIDDKIYTAQSTLNGVPDIDSFYTSSILKKENKIPVIRIKEPIGEINYYRYYVKSYNRNSDYINYVFDDKLINGAKWEFYPNRQFYNEGDSIHFILMGIEKQNFNYWKILIQNQAIKSDRNSLIAPSNPPTNIIGENVLGYFSAHSKKSIKMRIN